MELPDASVQAEAEANAIIDVDFWSSTSCTGAGRRYARVLLDGAPMASGPLTSLPATEDTTEQTSSVRASSDVGAGRHDVTVEVNIEPGTTCSVVKDYWHLRVDTLQ